IGYHVYWPFGEEWTPGNAQEGTPLKFTGHERDADPAGGASPLDYMHARFYRAEWGRFLAVDRAPGHAEEPQSWNRYVYGGNSPVTHLDPHGRDKIAAFVMGLAGGPAAAERYRNVSTVDAIFGRDATRQMQDAYRDTPLSFRVEAEITLGVLSVTRGPVASIAGRVLGAARSAAVDRWMDQNAERMNDKLGRKLGEGRLPFERSSDGAKQAREAIRNALKDPDAVRSDKFTTRGGNTATDIYSPKTGMTVRIREDGSFDTLIEGQTNRFQGRTPSPPPTPTP
ncbi:MAG TPA: RHS repeat-associated core domain-containing protein, partial [Thermoanaerobaculia bacterium]|nr:RHS repeat-associated core domain-containing protein [Thermoanaerobaculia bacterium]